MRKLHPSSKLQRVVLTLAMSLFSLVLTFASSDSTRDTLTVSDYQLIVDSVNARGLNTHSYPTTSENYYGASAYNGNFDIRTGNVSTDFATVDEAISESLSTIYLPIAYSNAIAGDTIGVVYYSYNNQNDTLEMLFVCVTDTSFGFERIADLPTDEGGGAVEDTTSVQGEFTVVQISGEATWGAVEDNGQSYMKINSYGQGANESWLITQKYELSDIKKNSFTYSVASYNSNKTIGECGEGQFEVYYATSPNRDVINYEEWTRLSSVDNLYLGERWDFIADTIELPYIEGASVTFAFRHVNAVDLGTTWEVADVSLQAVDIPVYILTDDDVEVVDGVLTSCSYDFTLKSIIIPDILDGQVVTAIDDGERYEGVFYDKSLVDVILPTTLQSIGDCEFRDNAIDLLRIPASVKSISYRAFYNGGVHSLVFEEGSELEVIGDYAFYKDTISSLSIPSNVISIGDRAFFYCSIDSLEFEEGSNLETIGDLAFYRSNIRSLTIPTSVKAIGPNSFRDNNIDSLSFEKGSLLTSIGERAFDGNSISSMTLPTPLDPGFTEWIDGNANSYTAGAVVADMYTSYAAKIVYTLTDEDVAVIDGSIDSCYYDFSSKFIVIPEMLDGQTVKGIGYNVFYNKGIFEVTLPSTLEMIANYAFRNNNFNTLSIPANVISIGDRAFYSSTIDSLVFEEGSRLESIGDNSFERNTLSTVLIPASVRTIGDKCFYSNTIDSLSFEEGSLIRTIGVNAFASNSITSMVLQAPQEEGFIAWIDGNGNSFEAGVSVTDFTTSYKARIPYTLTDEDVEVVDGILMSCSYDFQLTDIIIPDALDGQLITQIADEGNVDLYDDNGNYIGSDYIQSVFGSKGITSIILPSGIEKIGKYAFNDNKIFLLDISSYLSLTDIGSSAFTSNSIKMLNIPASVVSIGEMTFAYNGIDSIVFAEYSRLELIENYAFYDNSIAFLEIPSSVKSIGDMSFASCQIDSLIIEEGSLLTGIGLEAFNQNNISAMILPSPQEEGFIAWIDGNGNSFEAGVSVTDFSTSYMAKIPYTLTDEDVEVVDGILKSCSYDFQLTDIIIPDALDGQLITQIADQGNVDLYDDNGNYIGSDYIQSVFGSKGITSIILPSGIEKIGKYAFNDNKIFLLDISSYLSLTDIGSSAFTSNSIKMLNISASVVSIGEMSFAHNGIDSIVFAEYSRLELIENYAFYDNSIATLVIPASVETIENYAFQSCSIDSLVFEEGSQLTTIGEGAFRSNLLTEVVLPSSIINIEANAFADNDNLTGLVLPLPTNEGFLGWMDASANDYAAGDTIADFYTAYSAKIPYTLTDDDVVVINGSLDTCHYDFTSKFIIIPDVLDGQTVTALGYRVFYSEGIQEVTLPDSLLFIGERAFYRNSISSLTIPSRVESIDRYAFYNNSIQEINIEEGSHLQSIGYRSFRYNNLSTLVIPQSVLSIDNYAFQSCNIDSLVFEDGSQLQTIGSYSFSDNQLKNIMLPSSVISVGDYAFANNDSLTDLVLPFSTVDGFLEWVDGIANIYAEGDTVYDLNTSYFAKIPYTLTDEDVEVVDGILKSCSYDFQLTDIIIPDSLDGYEVIAIADGGYVQQYDDNGIYIGDSYIQPVFEYKGITSLELPLSLEKIGKYAFQHNSISALDFSNHLSLSSIGWEAFIGNRIADLKLPSALTAISSGSFNGNAITDLIIPSGIESIEQNAFSNNSIGSLTFEEGSVLSMIGSDAFYPSALDSLVLPNTVVCIGYSAFAGWDSDLSIVLPESSDEAFEGWFDGEGVAYEGGDTTANLFTSYVAKIPYTLTDDDVEMSEGALVSCSYDFSSKFIIIPDTLDNQAVEEFANDPYMGVGVFSGKSLQEVSLPNTLESIYSQAFEGNSITHLTIPANVKSIKDYAFINNNIHQLIFEEGSELSEIGSSAFSGCSLDSINLPNSVISIGTGAFEWSGLTSFVLPTPTDTSYEAWLDAEGNEYAGNDTIMELSLSYAAKIPYTLSDDDVEVVEGVLQSCSYDFLSKFVIIPEMLDGQVITKIGDNIFSSKQMLEVTLPSQLEEIGTYAFQSNQFKTIVIPMSVERIGARAFRYCSLDSLVFEEGSQLSMIGDYAFQSNDLDTIVLPNKLRMIGYGAFADNYDQYYQSQGIFVLPVLDYTSYEYWYDSNDSIFAEGDTVAENMHYNSYNAYVPYTLTGDDVELVDGTIVSAEYDLSYTDIIIPDYLNEQFIIGIDDYVFQSKSITSLTLPVSIESIGEFAFAYNNISGLNLDSCTSLVELGQYAFYDNGFNDFTLPIVLIDDFITWQYSSGQNVQEGALVSVYDAYKAVFPYRLTNADVKVTDGVIVAMTGDFSSPSLIIPNYLDAQTVTGIGEYLFSNRTISKVELPSTLETIGHQAFYNCSLDTVILPTNIYSVGYESFAGNNMTEMALPTPSIDGFVDWVQQSYYGTYVAVMDTVSDFVSSYTARIASHTLASEDVIMTDGTITSFDYYLKIKELIIPENLDGDTVMAIGYNAFNSVKLEAVQLPSTLRKIGKNAFESNAFVELVLPQSLEVISEYAFSANDSLVSVLFEEGSMLSSIGINAFYGGQLDSIMLPVSNITGFTAWQDANSQQYDGGDVVYNFGIAYVAQSSYYYELTDEDVEVEDGYIITCNYDFTNKNIIIPATLDGQSVIGISNSSPGVFQEKGITSIQLPQAIEYIGVQSFMSNSLTELSIPSNVKYINTAAFYKNAIDSVALSANVETVGEYAFYSNPLNYVILEDTCSLYQIGQGAFADMGIKLPVNSDPAFESWASTGIVYEADEFLSTSTDLWARIAHTLTEDEVTTVGGILVGVDYHPRYNLITMPESLGITSIDDKDSDEGVFENLDICEMSLPEGLTSIGYYAFRGNELDSILLPMTLTSIGNYAFVDNKMNAVSIPDGVTNIGQDAFSGNYLSMFTLPKVTSENFLGWQGNNTVYEVGEEVNPYGSYAARFPYTLTDADVVVVDNVIQSCTYSFAQKDIIIPSVLDGQKVLGIADQSGSDGVFYEKDIVSVVLPESLVSIGQYAFYRNPSLDSIFIPQSVEVIGDHAFHYCMALNLAFEDNSELISVGDYAFYYTELNSIEIPNSVVSIGYRAFYRSNLLSLRFEENSTLTSIGEYAFYVNYLDTVEIPNSVTTIGSRAFYRSNLLGLSFEENSALTSIGDYAFAYNYFLPEVSLPDSVSTIGAYAFYQTGLSSFTLPQAFDWVDGDGTEYNGGEFATNFRTDYMANFLSDDAVITTDSAMFYDTGGADDDYSSNEDYTITYLPATKGNLIQINFEEFEMYGSEYMTIYDGKTVNSGYLGYFRSSNPPSVFTASNSDGALTIKFHSNDYGVTASGWKALVTSIPMYADFSANITSYNSVPTEVSFGAWTSGQSVTSWSWDFDGDSIEDATVQNPNYTYTEEGEYDVSLTVSNDSNGYTITKEKYIAIVPPYTLIDEDVDVYNGTINSCSYDFTSKEIIIPDTLDGQCIVGIGYSVFSSKGITAVTLPSTLVSINDYAFRYNGLTKIELPQSVLSIGYYAFYGNNISELKLHTPVKDGEAVFLQWDDNNGNSYNAGVDVSNFGTSYTAIFNSYSITINVNDGKNAVAGASVTLGDSVMLTDTSGQVVFTGIDQLNTYYSYEVTADGHSSRSGNVYVNGDEEQSVSIYPFYAVSITVTDGEQPIPNAAMVVGGQSYYADENGVLTDSIISVGEYDYSIVVQGYNTTSGRFAIVDKDESLVIALTPIAEPVFSASFFVCDEDSSALENVVLTFAGDAYSSDEDGYVNVLNIGVGDYAYSSVKSGYTSVSDSATITNADISATLVMSEILTTVYSAQLEVYSSYSGAIAGAKVTVDSVDYYTTANGTITIPNLVNGVTPYAVLADGYYTGGGSITINGWNTYTSITLQEISVPTYMTTINVSDGTNAIDSAIVSVDWSSMTNTNGDAIFYLQSNTYDYSVVAEGYEEYKGSFTVSDASASIDLVMDAITDPVYTLSFEVTNGSDALYDAALTIDGEVHYTNWNGEVSLINMVDGSYNYSIIAQGYDDISGTAVLSGVDLTKTVEMTEAVEPSYAVSLSCNTNDVSVMFDGVIYTSDNGSVVLYNIDAGTYAYSVAAEGYDSIVGQLTVLNTNIGLNITLSEITIPTYTLKVNVTDGSDAFQGATVTLDNGISFITGANGVATFEMLEAGTYSYSVVAQGYTQASESITITDEDVSKNAVLSVITNTVYTLTVKVKGVDGNLNAASVTLADAVVKTNITGEAVFYNLEQGDYVYTVSASGYYDTTTAVAIISDTVMIIEMLMPEEPVYSMVISVLDGTTPIVGAQVVLDDGVSTLMTDAKGLVTFENMVEGEYSLDITADGYDSIMNKMIPLNKNVNKVVAMNLTTYDITFTVTDGNNAIEGATVTLGDYGSSVSDAYGMVSFSNVVPASSIAYSVSADAYNTVASTLELTTASVSEPVTLVLTTYTVTFTVTDGTSGIEGATVTFGAFAALLTDANGVVTFSNVLPTSDVAYSVMANGFDTTNDNLTVVDGNVDKAVVLVATTGLRLIDQTTVSIYPNPTENRLMIAAEKKYELRLYDVSGNLLIERTMESLRVELDLSGFSRGVYLLQLSNDNEAMVKRIVKE